MGAVITLDYQVTGRPRAVQRFYVDDRVVEGRTPSGPKDLYFLVFGVGGPLFCLIWIMLSLYLMFFVGLIRLLDQVIWFQYQHKKSFKLDFVPF